MRIKENRLVIVGGILLSILFVAIGFANTPKEEDIGARTVANLYTISGTEVTLKNEQTLTVTASSTQALQIEDAEGGIVFRVDTITNDGKTNIFGYSEAEAIVIDPSGADTAHSIEQSIQNTANNANQHTSVGIQAAHTDAFDLTKDFAGMAGLVLTANNTGDSTVSSTVGINLGMSNTTGTTTEALGINIFGLKISGVYENLKGIRFQDPGLNPTDMYAFDFEGNWLDATNMVSVKNDGISKYMMLSPSSTEFQFTDETTTTTVTIGDETSSRGCMKVRDVDGAGWSYGYTLNGAVTWSTTPCEQ
jgi:hypothetical protein